MKKKLAVKFAALMCMLTGGIATYSKLPDSFLLWGEPTPPMEDPSK